VDGAIESSRVLHGSTAVAELKRDTLAHMPGYLGVLHGSTAVAELKHH